MKILISLLLMAAGAFGGYYAWGAVAGLLFGNPSTYFANDSFFQYVKFSSGMLSFGSIVPGLLIGFSFGMAESNDKNNTAKSDVSGSGAPGAVGGAIMGALLAFIICGIIGVFPGIIYILFLRHFILPITLILYVIVWTLAVPAPYWIHQMGKHGS